MITATISSIVPEVTLAASALVLLLLGVLVPKEKNPFPLVLALSVAVLLGVAGQVFVAKWGSLFDGMFIMDSFAWYMKVLVLTGAAAALLMSAGFAKREGLNRIEFPILVLFSTLGMTLMISAGNLMTLYMGLELQSLPLYVLAAFRRDSVRATEAGLKYFVLGALSSGLLLYGMSLIYGFSGSTSFFAIEQALSEGASTGVIFGMALMLSGLLFKVSAVPFHMWAPDVYEGAPTAITAFFAIAPKVAAMGLLARVLYTPFGDLAAQWQQIIIAVSAASMALGAIAAVRQENIKRLLAYSSIGHMGYALMGFAAGQGGLKSVIVYMTLYAIMSAGAFGVVLKTRRETIADYAGLSKQHPLLAFAMAVMMFSMAGIPPLAGFFGKLFVFQAAVAAGLYTLAVFGVLTSVIAAYYYLRVVKLMYFDEAAGAGLEVESGRGLNLVLTLASLATLLFIVVPGPIVSGAALAAYALFR